MLSNLKLLVLEEPDPSISELLFTVRIRRSLGSACYQRATKFVNAIIRVLTNKQNVS